MSAKYMAVSHAGSSASTLAAGHVVNIVTPHSSALCLSGATAFALFRSALSSMYFSVLFCLREGGAECDTQSGDSTCFLDPYMTGSWQSQQPAREQAGSLAEHAVPGEHKACLAMGRGTVCSCLCQPAMGTAVSGAPALLPEGGPSWPPMFLSFEQSSALSVSIVTLCICHMHCLQSFCAIFHVTLKGC